MSQDVLPIPPPEPPAALSPTSRPGARSLSYVVMERFIGPRCAYEVGDHFSSEDDALVSELRARGVLKTRAELYRDKHPAPPAQTLPKRAQPAPATPLDEATWWRQFHAIFADGPTDAALDATALALAKTQLGPDYFPRVPKGFDALTTIRM